MLPSPVVVCWSEPWWDYISCACWFNIHLSSIIFNGWPHQCSYFQYRSYLSQFWEALFQCLSWWTESTGQGRSPVSWSWLMDDRYWCTSRSDTVTVISLSCITFPSLSVRYQRRRILGHYTNPWSPYHIWASDLRSRYVSSFPSTFLDLMHVPCFPQLRLLNHYLQKFGMVWFIPSPHFFNIIMLNSQVVCFNICTAF